MSIIKKLARPEIQAMKGYSSARMEASAGLGRENIWLNANEMPWSFLTETRLNRYPDPQPSKLIAMMADYYQVASNQVLAGRGSDEMIDVLIRAFCAAGENNIITLAPGFGMYKVGAAIQGAGVKTVNLEKENEFKVTTEAVLNQVDQQTKLVFLCSPNNPTGNTISAEVVLEICRKLSDKAMVILDEAYIEFATQKSLVSEVAKTENLIILRTFSKAFALAGVRLGALIGQPELINLLRKIMPPYPLPMDTIYQGIKALSDESLAEMEKRISIIKKERNRLISALQKLDQTVQVFPSEGNFLLVEFHQAEMIFKSLATVGIYIRNQGYQHGLEGCLRISIGRPAENNLLLDHLAQIDA